MKLLKIFGIVVGIHVFALILIFANPGCSSTAQPTPSPADTAAKPEAPAPTISVPSPAPADSPVASAPLGFDPNAPAVSVSVGIRYSPTRPGTPTAGALQSDPVADVTPATTYVVAKGDSLWTIAKKNRLTVSDLAAANHLKAGASVRLGQKLIVPGRALPPGTAAAAAVAAEPSPAKTLTSAGAPRASADAVKHTVKPGETLGAIARKYQVRMGDLATANNIADPAKIHPGMELVVPGWQAPAARAGKSGAKAAAPSAPALVIPTIAVSGDAPEAAKPAGDAPPVISVEEVPAPKQP
ncbi:MAG: LysM peptidoglycan-binding domain-containing protein [Opitutales bacterium]|nr:LysM peptidoglycan-binding domain-containing protein [Opitutales bacterium]